MGGFFSGEGCFRSIGKRLHITITQHFKDEFLMNVLKNTLNCGIITKDKRNQHIVLTINKFQDINYKIIPLFKENDRIKGIKSLDFYDFSIIAGMMEKKLHLEPLGIQKILNIKSNMNKCRNL